MLFFFYQTQNPVCCDATHYLSLGKSYAANGISGSYKGTDLRTYLYPLLLAYLVNISNFSLFPLAIFVFAIQSAFYFFSINRFTSVLVADFRLANSIYIALIFNILVYPFFSLTLTDSVYISFIFLWIYSFVNVANKMEHTDVDEIHLVLIGIPAFLSSVIFMIRPAGIWVVASSMLMYLWIFILSGNWKSRVILFSVIVALLILPAIPQIYINAVNFGKITPFPAIDLGSAQLQWGIENIKYGTYFGEGRIAGIYYKNPLYLNGDGIDWYLQNIGIAAGTLYIKLIGAFDYDFLFPYVYEKKPWYTIPLGMATLMIFLLGVWGALVHAFFKDKSFLKIGPRYFPLLCIICWSLFTIPAAVELRFSLPMFGFFIPFAIERCYYLYAAASKKIISFTCLILIYAAMLFTARYVRLLNPLYL